VYSSRIMKMSLNSTLITKIARSRQSEGPGHDRLREMCTECFVNLNVFHINIELQVETGMAATNICNNLKSKG